MEVQVARQKPFFREGHGGGEHRGPTCAEWNDHLES
jgi:hypothetical protein